MSISTMAENSALRFGGGPSLVSLAARTAASATGTGVDVAAATEEGIKAASEATGALSRVEVAARAAASSAEAQTGCTNVDVTAATEKGIQAASQATSTGITSSSALSQLVTYIPTETLALWLAIQTALGVLEAPPNQQVCDANFRGRWIWFGILLVMTALLTIGLGYRKQKETSPNSDFKLPLLETYAAVAAFSVWSLSLTNSPLEDICAYDPQVWGPVLLLGGTIVVAGAAYISGITVKWDKVLTETG